MDGLMVTVTTTFLNWRARATKAVRWGSNRKHKHESPITSQSLRSKEEPDPPTPQKQTRTSDTSSSASHIYHAEARDPTQPNQSQFLSGPEPAGTAQPKLEDNIPSAEPSNALIGLITSTGSEIQKPGKSKEDEILALNARLIEQQKDVSAKRLQVRESRTALRHKRDEVSELRSEWMEQLNTFFARLDHVDEELLRGFEQLQGATEEHMHMESSYHQEEDQLEEEEYMLTLSMESFAALSGSGSSPITPRHPRPLTQRAGPNTRRELPRCIISYLKRIADERMLQESLSELESEWFITLERQDEKYHPLEAEDSEFLRTFEKQRSDIWRDLTNAQMDVNSLRLVCIDQGYTNFDYEDLSSLNLFQYDGERILEPNRDPLKLGLEEEFLYISGNEAPDQDFDMALDLHLETSEVPPSEHIRFIPNPDHNRPHKSAEFVNKWMLHKLRISSMGIWHLQHLPIWGPLRKKGWEDHDISRYVLDRWYFDDAALAPLSSTSYYGGGETMIAPTTKRKHRVKSRSLPPPSRSPRKVPLQRYRTFPSALKGASISVST
ncbi:hypothetical protein ASPCAL05949 [Aspergillus calidoustus]|uniref:Uncharacterized protein n=1 Tax=Aspergillus calidoustus TaxID=454130 RepID=A0A0U5G318_ASPCI|nr:hypothetical protein ASPCAL05949 [Aspergillus calidoustus]